MYKSKAKDQESTAGIIGSVISRRLGNDLRKNDWRNSQQEIGNRSVLIKQRLSTEFKNARESGIFFEDDD
jgi:hypothetical protein